MRPVELLALDVRDWEGVAADASAFAAERGLPPVTDGELLRSIAGQNLALFRRTGAVSRPWTGYLCVDRRRGKVIVGTCGFKAPPDAEGMVEIAYFTFPEFEGQGVGRAIAARLVQVAGVASGVRRIRAHTLPQTNASTRILESLGFSRVADVIDPDDGPVWRWERDPHKMNVRESYDSAARAYAEHLASELDRKPLDRHLLNRFAEEMRGRGLVVDLGCGPGHLTKYLHDRDLSVVGVDLSPEMIATAVELNPGIDFRVGDMQSLDFPTASLAGIVAFYSIVHFQPEELGRIVQELRRVLAPGGLVLIAFHVGKETLHVDDLFGAPVDLDFRFHEPAGVTEALRSGSFTVIEHTEREPYEGAEYASRRCYLLAKAS